MRTIIFIFLLISNYSFAISLYEKCKADAEGSTTSCTSSSIPNMIIDKDNQLIRLEKDIFETTATFKQRKKDLEKRLEIDILNAINTLLASNGAGKATMTDYNADTQLMKLSIEWNDELKDIFPKKDLVSKTTLYINPSDAGKIFRVNRTQKFNISKDYVLHNLRVVKMYIKDGDKKHRFNYKYNKYIIKIGNKMWEDIESQKGNYRYAINYCKDLTLGGYSDWRLPNKSELKKLYQNKSKLKNVIDNWYWTSTTYESDSTQAWVVYFYDGYDGWNFKTLSGFVRCVR